MTTADIVTNLLNLGQLIASAAAKPGVNLKTFDWQAFLSSADFEAIRSSVQSLLDTMATPNVDAAIADVEAQQAALLRGRAVEALADDEMIAYAALASTKLILAAKNVQAALDANLLSWVAENALPTLEQVAPVVIPLLTAVL